MIETIRPHMFINEKIIKSKFENTIGYFLVDNCGNKYQVSKEVYDKFNF